MTACHPSVANRRRLIGALMLGALCLSASLPVLAALTPPVRLEFVVDEIVRIHVTEQHDITSATTIATIGPAPRLIFFAAKADTAPPTITSR